MRKLGYLAVITLVISLFSSLAAFSETNCQNNICPGKPYPVSNFVTRGLQGITGLNWFSKKQAETQIKEQIKKSLDKGDIEVQVTPYSAMDLLAGKAQGFDIKGKDIEVNGVSISSFEVKSLCDFIYLDYKKDPIKPLAPLYMGFKGTVTENDLNKILASKEYQENLERLKVKFGSADFSLIDFLNPKFNIDNNKIFLSAEMHFIGLPKFMNVPVKMGAGLKVENNKIKFTDMQMYSNDLGTDMGPVSDIAKRMTLAIFDLDSLNKNGTEVKINDIKIGKDKVDVQGTVLLSPQETK